MYYNIKYEIPSSSFGSVFNQVLKGHKNIHVCHAVTDKQVNN